MYMVIALCLFSIGPIICADVGTYWWRYKPQVSNWSICLDSAFKSFDITGNEIHHRKSATSLQTFYVDFQNYQKKTWTDREQALDRMRGAWDFLHWLPGIVHTAGSHCRKLYPPCIPGVSLEQNRIIQSSFEAFRVLKRWMVILTFAGLVLMPCHQCGILFIFCCFVYLFIVIKPRFASVTCAIFLLFAVCTF